MKQEVNSANRAVVKIITPNVVAAAREHFGCTTLDGAELEQLGAFFLSVCLSFFLFRSIYWLLVDFGRRPINRTVSLEQNVFPERNDDWYIERLPCLLQHHPIAFFRYGVVRYECLYYYDLNFHFCLPAMVIVCDFGYEIGFGFSFGFGIGNGFGFRLFKFWF
jgi:hypothetical protein